MPSLKQPSSITTTHLKIEIAYTWCNTIDTYLLNVCKTKKGRLPIPFTPIAMLAHQ